MRVPELILNCVGFVGEVTHKGADGSVSGDLYATGFFVSIPILEDSPVPRAAYFVTAKHVAKDLQNREIYFLVNQKGGGVTSIRNVIGNQWQLHPNDPTVDVAVIQVGVHPEADIDPVGVEHFGTRERLRELNIGIGDEVHSTGLFTPYPGEKRNMPILRIGNIAMMPEERIQTDLGFAEVYLIEARSLGGISGSPVFVRPTINFELPPELVRANVKNAFWHGHGATLLGLMHGHWDIKESEMNKAFFTHDRKHGVNMGIAIVVPAVKILETLNKPDFVEVRETMKEMLKRSLVPGTDSRKPQETPKREFTREDFEAALKKASRKVEPPQK